MNINAFKIATALVVCTGLSGCVSLKETVPMELYPESSHYVNPDKQDSYFGSGYQQLMWGAKNGPLGLVEQSS